MGKDGRIDFVHFFVGGVGGTGDGKYFGILNVNFFFLFSFSKVDDVMLSDNSMKSLDRIYELATSLFCKDVWPDILTSLQQ